MEDTEDKFVIDKVWFNRNRECPSGINSAQANAIGIGYPPPKGWRRSTIGLVITMQQKLDFEAAKGMVSKVRKKQKVEARKQKIFTAEVTTAQLELQLEQLRAEIRRLKKANKAH